MYSNAKRCFSSKNYHVQEEQVGFYLRTRELGLEEVKLNKQNLYLLENELSINFLIHGYNKSRKTQWVEAATQAFLSKENYNIIQVDWFEPAHQEYEISTNNTEIVGRHSFKHTNPN